MREEATQKIFDKIKPGFVFSGHSHYNCFYKHPNGNHPFSTTTFGAIPSSSWVTITTKQGVQEVTVSTFNWRNRIDPSFVLATVQKSPNTPDKAHTYSDDQRGIYETNYNNNNNNNNIDKVQLDF